MHIIAIPESVKLILKKVLIPFLNIQRVEVEINTNEEIFVQRKVPNNYIHRQGSLHSSFGLYRFQKNDRYDQRINKETKLLVS